MDAIEKAIRNAFEKGNADDRAFREKVYRSAFAALDRALQANPGVTVEAAINRRKAMQAKIAAIESEFLPAVAVSPAGGRGDDSIDAPIVEPPTKSAPAVAAVAADDAPPVSEPGAAHSRVGPAGPDIGPEPPLAGSPPAASAPASEVAPDRDERRARRRFPLTGAILGLALLAAAGAGLWWAARTGVFKAPLVAGQAARPPANATDGGDVQAVDDAAPRKPGEGDRERNWITVFTPSDPTLVRVPSDARADVMKDDTGSFIRIRAGASGSPVGFVVGQGILQELAGKHAVFDVIARAEDGKDTQISVDCDFGELGDCGRRRYAVGHEKNEYLFDVQFPDQRAGAAGVISIDPDFDRQGKSVDVYEIRASTAP